MASPQHSGVHRIADIIAPVDRTRPATIEPPPSLETQPGRTSPAPGAGEGVRFLHRELTYLTCCERVLHEAADERTPLLERLKFVAIVASNVDEFFMKRIGGLKQQVGANVHSITPDGRTPAQQVSDSHKMIQELERRRAGVLTTVLAELKKHGVWLASWKELEPAQHVSLRDYYLQNIFPLVTPQSMDPAHPFPFVSNLSLNLLVTLRYPDDPEPLLARVKIPIGAGIPRFLRVGTSNTFVGLEDVMANNLDLLFPGMQVGAAALVLGT